ncbi:MAG: RNA polymerase sigma factor [Myxococcaceae bacterium]|nr:RNA polymerase sigma factor [Myxococcaceae bacterium]
MERFCDGDARAFDALFARYAAPIRGYLLRATGDPATAEDLLQGTFLSLVRARGRFLRGHFFRPWLYAIATNAVRDHLRRRRPEVLTELGELPTDAAEPTPPSDAGLKRAVRDALAQLPANQREVILLHRFEGLSMAEVAEAVGASEAAVKVRAHRGYERLRQLLQGVWEEQA